MSLAGERPEGGVEEREADARGQAWQGPFGRRSPAYSRGELGCSSARIGPGLGFWGPAGSGVRGSLGPAPSPPDHGLVSLFSAGH